MRTLLTLFLVLFATTATAQDRSLNHLAGEHSLYLQQHASNPVDWYPWGHEALEKAESEGKLIFVSVGYAACHWCHVMEEESFENTEIAAFLNSHFVSIKIDRERRPDLDAQFITVTSALTGSSGWPNSVFLTPDGNPFFAGTYFPPTDFLNLLTTITDVWRDDETSVRIEAFTIADQMRNYLDQTAVLGDISSADINAAAIDMVGHMDDFNGGFGDTVKFPRENNLLFLLDQANRTGDDGILVAVTLTLDAIIKGGINDHVGGGFHRYATDPEWNIPHFEKMLYNQALISRALTRAYSATSNPDYARTAQRTLDYVLREMRDPAGGFYAAQDADSLDENGARREGAFYAWTQAQMQAVLGAKSPIPTLFNTQADGAFEGANILYTNAPPLTAAAQGGISASALDTALAALRRTRGQTRAAPIIDKKIVLAWNGEMISTLAEAGLVFNRPDYLAAAENAADFILTHMQTQGSLKRIWLNGRAGTNAQLSDYAAFGLALIALYDYGTGDDDRWLAPADRLAKDMLALFGDPDQAMRNSASHDGLGPFRPLDDKEIASGNALALSFLTRLNRRMARVGKAAPRLAAALAIDAINAPSQRAAILTALANLKNGPANALRTSNGGAVRVFACLTPDKTAINFTIRIRKGWHINAHKPLEDYLIGMALKTEATRLPASAFPTAEIKTLGFSENPLALYEQDFTLSTPIPTSNGPHKTTLTLQACNDQVCLPPNDMVFWSW